VINIGSSTINLTVKSRAYGPLMDVPFTSTRYYNVVANASTEAPKKEDDAHVGSSVRLINRAHFLQRRFEENSRTRLSDDDITNLIQLILAIWDGYPNSAPRIFSDAFLTVTGDGELQIEWEDSRGYLELTLLRQGLLRYLWQKESFDRMGEVNFVQAAGLVAQARGADIGDGLRSTAS
jgi:hypothetical protein